MLSSSSLPETLPWKDRHKSLEALPGGYRDGLEGLRRICTHVDRHQPVRNQLESFLRSEFDISHTNSKQTVTFFLRTNLLLKAEDGPCRLGYWTQQWLDTDDDAIMIALMHRDVRFMGELLEELATAPRSVKELLSIANRRYGLPWQKPGNIVCRRGWLQAAGYVETVDKKLAITNAGTHFLTRLGVTPASPSYVPTPEPVPSLPPEPVPTPEPVPDPPPEPAPWPEPVRDSRSVDDLATEIEEASTDSQNHRRFERAVHDAFAYLGLRAELLGSSGKTDVLLHAQLGRSDSYKVTVDAKTTASGHLPDGQVDWATLAEHRTNEGADYSLLVGPNPTSSRLFERAVHFRVTVLSAQRLAELCRRHAHTPPALDDYRLLFANHGQADLTELEERAKTAERLRTLAAEICRILAKKRDTHGYLTAQHLWALLPHDNEVLIQSVLDALASPLVGAIHGNRENGYVLASDPKVAQLRLTLLGKELTSPEQAR